MHSWGILFTVKYKLKLALSIKCCVSGDVSSKLSPSQWSQSSLIRSFQQTQTISQNLKHFCLFPSSTLHFSIDLCTLLQKQIFQKMLYTLHSKKSLSADRRDWKLFNYYSLKHFIGVKSARMRVQLARVSPGGATGSYWPLVASTPALTPAHPPPPPTARIFSTSLLLV